MNADINAIIKIEKNGKLYDISESGNMLAPIVFRVHYYDGKYGFIVAVDVVREGIQSDVKLFNNPYDVETFVHREREGRKDFIIAYTREPLKELLHLESNEYDNVLTADDFSHLRKIVDKQKRELMR